MADDFAFYVSCVEGHPVSRYGGVGYIGAERSAEGLTFYPERVIAFTVAEISRFRREYSRAIAAGSLRERTKADYVAASRPAESAEKKSPKAKASAKKEND